MLNNFLENNILNNQELKEEIIDSKNSVMKINFPILKNEIHAETFLEMDIIQNEETGPVNKSYNSHLKFLSNKKSARKVKRIHKNIIEFKC